MSIISTKITPPRQGQPLVKRTRLLRELKNNVGRNLSLIEAPAGYGKTTLLYQLRLELIDKGFSVAWYSLDGDDNEQVTFLEYLSASLQHALNRRIGTAVQYRFSALGGVSSLKSEISRILNEIAQSGQRIALIFDDFHFLEDGHVTAACEMLIDYAPDNLHIAVGSRSKLPFPITKLLGQGKAAEFGAEDLRFRIEETESYFRVASKLALSPYQIFVIQGSTEGWVAGLQLTSLALKRKTISDDLISNIAQQSRTVRNFLAEQVLDAQEDDVRLFLLRSSVLPRFNVELCNHVMNIDDAAEIIETLDEDNLFLFSLTEDGEWFRYHHSFAGFLASRLQYERPEEVAELHVRACDWFNERDFVSEAINHAIEAQDFGLAEQLLEEHAMRLVQQGKTTTLLGFMKRIPGFGTRTPPMLKLAVAWSLILVRRPDEAIDVLQHLGAPRADRALEVRKEVARLTAMCWQDRPIEAKERIRELLATGEVVDPWDYGVLNNNLIYASIFDGNLFEAEAAYRELINSDQSLYTTVYSKVLMGICLKTKMRLLDAATLFQDALELSEREAGPQSPAAALAAANLVEILYEWNDLPSVFSILEGRMEIIDETSLNDVLLSVYRPLIRLYCNLNRLEEANKLIAHILRIAREQYYGMRLEASILFEDLRIQIMRDKLQAAGNCYTQLEQFIDSLDVRSAWIEQKLRERRLLAEAYLLHARGQHDKAVANLDELCEIATACGNDYNLIYYRIFRTINLYAGGERSDSLATFGALLQMAEASEMIRTLTDFGKPFEAILAEIIELSTNADAPRSLRDLNKDYLNALRKVMRASADGEKKSVEALDQPPPPPAYQSGPVRLTNRQIEILQLIAKGLSNKEIASSLFIALDTVKWHLKIIYNELEVNSRTQAIARGKEVGVI